MNTKYKPLVCLIDEDENVKKGWEKALHVDAQLMYFPDHLELINSATRDKNLTRRFSCVVMGRYFKHLSLDVMSSNALTQLRNIGAGPIFLNWQGFVTKDEAKNFDGKLFHRYGVKWHTLRSRIQKCDKTQKPAMTPRTGSIVDKYSRVYEGACKQTVLGTVERLERCSFLLKEMAERASGTHRERLELYAYEDLPSGRQLLEAIYNRLLTDKNRPDTCPSRYINSSPVIAQRVLFDVLYS